MEDGATELFVNLTRERSRDFFFAIGQRVWGGGEEGRRDERGAVAGAISPALRTDVSFSSLQKKIEIYVRSGVFSNLGRRDFSLTVGSADSPATVVVGRYPPENIPPLSQADCHLSFNRPRQSSRR